MRDVKRTIRASAKDVIAELAPPPQWIEPELCKLVTRIPAGDNWAHEIKFDGYRMHARIVSGAAALLTRNGLDWTAKYPDVAAAIGSLKCRQAYVDGELCAVLPDRTTSFAGLQGHGDAPAALVYFAFNLLHLDGEELMRLPLLERKARLETLLGGAPPVIRFSGHVIGNGARVFEEGSKLGVEGMVSKQIDGPYIPGNRGVWVKTKFLKRQEFVIVGWTDPEGSRSSPGALWLGYYRDDDKLISAGRAGIGMTEFELLGLLEKLRPLASDRMTVGVPPPKTSGLPFAPLPLPLVGIAGLQRNVEEQMRLVEGAFRQAFQEQRRALLPHFIGGRSDRGESRAHVLREIEAVETRHLQVLRYREMPVEGPGQSGNRHLIVAAHEDIRQPLPIDISTNRQLGIPHAFAATDDDLQPHFGAASFHDAVDGVLSLRHRGPMLRRR